MAELLTGRGIDHDEWRRNYDRYLADATERYADVLHELHACEIPATMEQTGGMCLAIMWPHAGGYFMLTDADEPLSFERDHDQGWGLGLYDADGDMVWDDLITHPAKTVGTAIALVQEGFDRLRHIGAP